MVESSVGIAAAYQLSALADYFDLDGRLLIESDPFIGLSYTDGRIAVADDNGHGVSFA
jgi:L-alanine-DL-glutamate epimerase-like enolase superfamily enzyme